MPIKALAVDNKIDNAPLLRMVEARDADEQAANLSQWNQLYDQLSPGTFLGKVTELWLPQSQVFVETANQTLRQTCAAWDDSLWFGIPAPGTGLMSWGGRELPANAICVREGGAEFELLTAPDFNLFGIVVQREAFGAYLDATGQTALDDLMTARDVVCLPIEIKVDVCSNLARILGDADRYFPLAMPGDDLALQGRIFASLARLLGAGGWEDVPVSRRDNRQVYRHPALERLRTCLLDNPGEQVAIETLCTMFHLSRRALQNYFEEATGLAPLAYMRALRLNAVHRDLLHGEQSVSEVACAWGFNHLGKFSHQYQLMFGELPSQTRSRRH